MYSVRRFQHLTGMQSRHLGSVQVRNHDPPHGPRSGPSIPPQSSGKSTSPSQVKRRGHEGRKRRGSSSIRGDDEGPTAFRPLH